MNCLTVYFNSHNFGVHQTAVDCPSKAVAFALQIEPLNGDNTGLNGLKFECEDGSTVENTGPFGSYDATMTTCSGGFIAARMRNLGYQVIANIERKRWHEKCRK